jgi:hypothetical protein
VTNFNPGEKSLAHFFKNSNFLQQMCCLHVHICPLYSQFHVHTPIQCCVEPCQSNTPYTQHCMGCGCGVCTVECVGGIDILSIAVGVKFSTGYAKCANIFDQDCRSYLWTDLDKNIASSWQDHGKPAWYTMTRSSM